MPRDHGGWPGHRPALGRKEVAIALTVAVTGPTGEIGLSAVGALEREPAVERIVGMARRPFEPAARGWTKTEYRRGDILDRDAVTALVADADVVVHLAYLIMGSRGKSRGINVVGTRNVVEATVASRRARRLIYTSSVAAYGFYPDNPVPLTEDVPARGSTELYYSQQKAECEALLREITTGTNVAAYVLRPCVVAGPTATVLADSLPWRQLSRRLPGVLRSASVMVQSALPLMPDPGVPLQLVHQDDVAAAIRLAVIGAGVPGAYNVAADGEVFLRDVAAATGTRAIRIPRAMAVLGASIVTRLPLLPSIAEWIYVVRSPVIMDTSRAKNVLGWRPQYTSRDTLAALARAT